MASVLLNKRVQGSSLEADEVYVIYGAPGSGKTTLASTFPKTKEAPMLYIDILEGGTTVISKKELDNIEIVLVSTFEEFNDILQDLDRGYAIDENGNKVPLKYSTIVIDTVTNLEHIHKEYLKEVNKKTDMTLQLWGKARDTAENIYNILKRIHQNTGAIVIAIAHDKTIEDEEDPSFNKSIPSLMKGSAYALAAKASYVWYTKVEKIYESEEDGKVNTKIVFNTYIDAYPYLVTKCRKPKDFIIQNKVTDLTYDKFKKNVLDKL